MKQKTIRKYARLIARVGVNVQKGQLVVIDTAACCEDFAAILAEECYRAGAGKVMVEFYSDKLTKIGYRYQKLSTMKKVSKWVEEKAQEEVDENAAKILIESGAPDALKGISTKKLLEVNRARRAVMKKYRDAVEGIRQWCIAAVPSKAWAKAVFPDERPAAAVEKLWKAILDTVYVTDDNDPEAVWAERRASFTEKCEWLNSLDLRALEYKSAKGTDLKLGLIPGAMFTGGGDTSKRGVYFVPNLPTEEIFSSPMRGVAEGVVYATKPLSYNGSLIEDFSITFKDGKAVSWSAAKGADMLDTIIKLDEGASMLGEVAIVPVSSPVGRTGVLFLNTLFDENASCHLALGHGFTEVIKGWENMSKEEIEKAGVNDSLSHVDFMIGDETLDITGITGDGKRVPILVKGEWAC
ncbi:MAG: aminopeptidase [Clostridia bacterium]|nr:aminopeptidase [Clostridia bacterium]